MPNAYPITAPTPPHVAAATGPNKIQAPKADATRLVVSENKPMFLFAVKSVSYTHLTLPTTPYV